MHTFRPRHLGGRRARAVLLAAGLLLSGVACSGSDAGDGDGRADQTGTTAATSSDASWDGNRCDQGATTDAVEAAAVDGTPSDLTVTSFDGTEIRAHWFPVDGASADEPAPTVLMGPGWSQPGDTSVDGDVLFGALGISPLNDAGYNVLTWDPRGFGASTGAATVNSPDAEGRDVQILLDWVAEQPEAQLDGDGDPRSGMVGFSYGGGIQLTVAAIDCRVDAIVPGTVWHSLETSLFKAETVKTGWSEILVTAGEAFGTLDPHITSASTSGLATGTLSDEDRDWFVARGPGEAIDAVDVPTLLIQGTVDTLFTLDEALTIGASLTERGVPTKTLWFCGGHGTCLTDTGDPERVGEASFAWLDRWVKGDPSADTGAAFDIVDQDGTRWRGDAVPDEDGTVAARLSGPTTLALTADGGSGPSPVPPKAGDILGNLVVEITPAPAANAVEAPVEVPADAVGRLAVGAPRLTLTYRGTAPDGDRPTRIFAQIVDRERGVVVGNQITPIAVTLDGASHTVEVDLEVIAQRLPTVGEDGLVLQIVATTTGYAEPRLGGEVAIDAAELQIPLVSDLTAG